MRVTFRRIIILVVLMVLLLWISSAGAVVRHYYSRPIDLLKVNGDTQPLQISFDDWSCQFIFNPSSAFIKNTP